MKARIISNFSRVQDVALNKTTLTILKSMTGNADFANPIPALSIIKNTAGDYRRALAKCYKNCPRSLTEAKNELRRTLEAQLSQLAKYVELTAQNDLLKLQGCGFALWKKREHIGTLPKPLAVSVISGALQGALQIRTRRMKRAKTYVYRLAEVNAGKPPVWQTYQCTRSKIVIKDLTEGKAYCVQVAAMASSETLAWSSSIVRYVS